MLINDRQKPQQRSVSTRVAVVLLPSHRTRFYEPVEQSGECGSSLQQYVEGATVHKYEQ